MAYSDPNDPRAKEARLRHYYRNKETYFANARKREADMRDYVVNLKNNSGCVNCGICYPGEPWLLEFDHREQSDKVNIISKIVKNGSWVKLKEEIEKCDILCVVCHRRKTAIQLGWSIRV